MKTQIKKYLLPGIILLIAIASIFPLIDNEGRVDWFGAAVHQAFIVVFWIIFFPVYAIVAFIVSVYNEKIPLKRIRNNYLIALVGAIIIVVAGIVKFNMDYNKWEANKKIDIDEWLEEKGLHTLRSDSLFFEVKVDSLEKR